MSSPPEWDPWKQGAQAPPQGVPQDVSDAVRAHFSLYEAHEDRPIGTYYLHEEAPEIEERFEALRKEIKPKGYEAAIREEGGERVLNVFPEPQVPDKKPWINWALFVATWVTTTLAGAFAVFGYRNPDFCYSCYGADAFMLPLGIDFVTGGFLQFALPLMAILGVHEMGHYVASRYHGLTPSYPYFIPLPPIFAVNIGTLGAFISLREPIPSRKALFDIGASGPLAGLVIAIPVVILGSWLMVVDPVTAVEGSNTVFLGTPLLFDALAWPFAISSDALIHPVAMAGWVGLLVTGINLLPTGQLDGGHIATALLADHARLLSSIALGVLVLLGLGVPPFTQDQWIPGYSGWLVFAIIILFLGTRHPPPLNSVSDLDPNRTWLGILTFVLAVACFTPLPISL